MSSQLAAQAPATAVAIARHVVGRSNALRTVLRHRHDTRPVHS